MIGFKASLCAKGDPCLPEASAKPELLHDFGDFELFKHKQVPANPNRFRTSMVTQRAGEIIARLRKMTLWLLAV
jgi:hypothetical protein